MRTNFNYICILKHKTPVRVNQHAGSEESVAAITPDRDPTAHTHTHRRPLVSLRPAVVWCLEKTGNPEARTQKVNRFHSYINHTETDRGYLHQPLNKRSSIYLNTHKHTQLTHRKHTVTSVETHMHTKHRTAD